MTVGCHQKQEIVLNGSAYACCVSSELMQESAQLCQILEGPFAAAKDDVTLGYFLHRGQISGHKT